MWETTLFARQNRHPTGCTTYILSHENSYSSKFSKFTCVQYFFLVFFFLIMCICIFLALAQTSILPLSLLQPQEMPQEITSKLLEQKRATQEH